MEKLTAEIAAKYWGCRVKTPTGIGTMGILYGDAIEGQLDNSMFFSSQMDCCQLVLKPLNKISDEDAIKVAKIVFPLPFQKHTKGWRVARDYAITGWPYIKIHNQKNIYSVEIDCKLVMFTLYNMEDVITQEHPTDYVKIIDFLRSRSYDVDGLIEKGIAGNMEN